MRTLSIRQPWAWLITHRHMPLANRDDGTDYRGRFLIHAGQHMVQRDYWTTADRLKAELGIEVPHFLELPRGGIVGAATLVDVVTAHDSPFFIGPFGYVLDRAVAIPFVEVTGQRGWFSTPRSAFKDMA